MKNYLNFETDIKNLEEELDKLIKVKLTKEYGRSKVIFGTLS